MGGVRFEGEALLFGGKRIMPKARQAGEMLQVVRFPQNLRLDASQPTYYMYREAEKLGNIRYDITRILSLDLCGEKNKTFGHVHPKSSSNVEWPEIYEVLSGKAHFLLQKSPFGEVEEALLLYAKKGDCVIIPPGFGHVTINAGKGDLVLANLVSCRFEADYSLFAKLKGGCIYEMADGTLVKNENYKGDFEAKKSKADEFSAQFKVFEPFSEGKIIEVARKSREKIEFLDRPQLFC